jgi:hypothetical protein
MVVDECLLRIGDGLLDGVKLLGDFDAVSTRLDHRDRAAQMALGTLQAKHDVGVRFVERFFVRG